MNNSEIYKAVFVESLQVPSENFNENIEYNEVPEWDSIGHMSLVSNIEEKFNIEMDIDDIIEFSDYKKGKEILKKYEVEIL